MWPTILKLALVAFLVLVVAVIVVVFVRNARAKGFPTKESSGHYDQIKGAMPPMPRPDDPPRPLS